MGRRAVNDFNSELASRLDTLREQNLFRALRRVDSPQSPRIKLDGRTVLNFSSNDYLGLANHPALKEAAIKAIEQFGAGAGASRLLSGSLAPFHQLEEALADFKGTEAALTFSTGFATAVGTIGGLMGRDDVVILDKLAHASIVDGARLCGARLRVFAHNDLADLEDKLQWAARHSSAPGGSRKGRTLVVTESIFSMDGDAAPLREIVALKEKYGAWLMADEAHATGVAGKGGRGLAGLPGVAGRIEVQMGTLGKALGASGGYICGSRPLIDLLVNRARSFIFSTAPVPAAAAAATAGIQLAQSSIGEKLRAALSERVAQCRAVIAAISVIGKTSASRKMPEPAGAILPLILGGETRTLEVAGRLMKRDIYVPAIRYPTVARGAARLRLTVTAAHTREDLSQIAAGLADAVNPPT